MRAFGGLESCGGGYGGGSGVLQYVKWHMLRPWLNARLYDFCGSVQGVHVRQDLELEDRRTYALMHHVYFQRMILAIEVMLGRRVHVELNESEVRSCDACGAVRDHFDSGTQVLKLGLFYCRDIDLWLLSEDSNRVIWLRGQLGVWLVGDQVRVPRLMGD